MHPIREIKPYSHHELSDFYGVSEKVLHNWIKPFENQIGPKIGRFYNVIQVNIILNRLGIPRLLEDTD